MRVLFLTSGPQVPSTRFRILPWLPLFRERGIECVVAHSRPAKYRGWPWLGNRLSEGPRIAGRLLDWLRFRLQRFGRRPFDVVVVERELFATRLGALEGWFRRLGDRMVLDVDDAIFLAHPAKFRRIAGLADVVVAGNELLRAEIAACHPRVVVVPTCLDLRRYPVASSDAERPPDTPLVLGWTGTAANVRYLEPVAQPLQALSVSRPLELRVIAESEAPLAAMDFGATRVRFVRWREKTEIEDLLPIEVGLAPLPDEPWTRYKCGLKVLQAMALGRPVIASPVGVQAEIVRDGEYGLLAETPDEWARAIARLHDDPAARESLGRAGRRSVEERFSLERHLESWLAVLRG